MDQERALPPEDPAPWAAAGPRRPGTAPRRPGPAITPGDLGAVFVGGAVGTIARVAFATWFPTAPGAYPWTTFAENVIGALLLGLVLALLLHGRGSGRRLHLLLGTGALGSFTTYSTFAVELERLVGAGSGGLAAAYAAASILAGIGAAITGMWLGRRLRRNGAEVSR